MFVCIYAPRRRFQAWICPDTINGCSNVSLRYRGTSRISPPAVGTTVGSYVQAYCRFLGGCGCL